MAEKPGEQQDFIGLRADLRLVLRDPVDLGLGAKMIDRRLRAEQLEQPAPGPLDPAAHLGLALIEPEDRRAQRLAQRIDMDQRSTLGGQCHALDQPAVDIHRRPQPLAGLAEAGPVIFRVLLGPAGLSGIIGLEFHLALAEQIALQVEQQRTHALGAVIDGQQVAFFAQGTVLTVSRTAHPTWLAGCNSCARAPGSHAPPAANARRSSPAAPDTARGCTAARPWRLQPATARAGCGAATDRPGAAPARSAPPRPVPPRAYRCRPPARCRLHRATPTTPAARGHAGRPDAAAGWG